MHVPLKGLNGRVTRVRPVELTRGGFDSILEFIKTGKFDMVWVDLAQPRRFVGTTKLSQVTQRI